MTYEFLPPPDPSWESEPELPWPGQAEFTSETMRYLIDLGELWLIRMWLDVLDYTPIAVYPDLFSVADQFQEETVETASPQPNKTAKAA